MTVQEKNLKETVREVIGEPTANSETTEQSNQSDISKSQSGETQSGGTPEYVSGIDISDIPEQDRPRIKQKLEEKAKLLEKGYQPKFQEVATLKKSLEWMASKGLTPEKAEKILTSALEAEQNPNPTKQQEKDKRTLDKLMETSPVETRQSLEQMRQIVKEESEVEKFEKRVAELEKRVGYFQSKDMQLGEEKLTSDLEGLKDRFGKDLIDKYSDSIKIEWRKFPQSKAKDILKYVVPDDEYDEAISLKKTKPREKAGAITNTGSGVASASEGIDTSGKWKNVLSQIIKTQK